MWIFACGTDEKITYALPICTIRVTMLRFQYKKSCILKQGNFQFLETTTCFVFSIYFLLVKLTLLTNGITRVKWTSLELKKYLFFKILNVYLQVNYMYMYQNVCFDRLLEAAYKEILWTKEQALKRRDRILGDLKCFLVKKFLRSKDWR